MLPKGFDAPLGLSNALDFLVELDALHRARDEYDRAVDARNDAYAKSTAQRGAVNLPAIEDVVVRGHSYILGADRASLAIYNLAHLFYPGLTLKKGWFGDLKNRMVTSEPSLSPYLTEIEGGLKLIRNARNAVEHKKPGHRTILRNYELKADGSLHVPTIEIEHAETPLSPTDLGTFVASINGLLINAYEGVLVALCSIHVESVSQLPVFVVELPEDQRRYSEVRFGYASKFGDEIVPYLN